jgi:hypothetical protein
MMLMDERCELPGAVVFADTHSGNFSITRGLCPGIGVIFALFW